MSEQATNLNLGQIQRLRKAALLALGITAVCVLAFVHSAWPKGAHEIIESAGIWVLIVAIAGRAWCTLYIGGRKLASLVTTGPYSVSRNPLYLFTFLGVAGIGLQTGAVTPGLFLAAATIMVFRPVVIREERVLLGIFGEDYARYCTHVPRFGPSFANWQDSESLEISPRRLMRTVADALPLLLAYPVMEGIEYLQQSGFITAFVPVY
jgi:protein-S-isoprenylcysteine O-methyltransferase Ste14